MPRISALRRIVDQAIEAYDVALTPSIGPIYENSMRWGVDPERYADPSDPALTHQRAHLLQFAIDTSTVIERHLSQLAKDHGTKRADKLKGWLNNEYDQASLSHWQRKELNADQKRLLLLIRAGQRPITY